MELLARRYPLVKKKSVVPLDYAFNKDAALLQTGNADIYQGYILLKREMLQFFGIYFKALFVVNKYHDDRWMMHTFVSSLQALELALKMPSELVCWLYCTYVHAITI